MGHMFNRRLRAAAGVVAVTGAIAAVAAPAASAAATGANGANGTIWFTALAGGSPAVGEISGLTAPGTTAPNPTPTPTPTPMPTPTPTARTTGGGSGTTSGGTTPPATGVAPVPSEAGLAASKVAVSKRGQAPLVVTCTGAASCSGTVKLVTTMNVTVRRGKRTVTRNETVTLGSAHYSVAGGAKATVEVTLSKVALKAIAAHGSRLMVGAVLSGGGEQLLGSVTLIGPRTKTKTKQ